jgi:hypothetical protein
MNKLGTTHHDLWAGIDFKLDNAKFQFGQMAHALRPAEPLPQNPALLASIGATFDANFNWHQEFYASLDAFLSAARSVPELIRCCFGADRNSKIRDWFDGLDVAEQQRRQRFEEKFTPDYDAFRALPLGTARHISEHRTGYAPVTVTITGRFGVTYTGDAITRLPIAEPPSPDYYQLGFMPPATSLKPRWTDFDISGGSLFDACRCYLESAQALIWSVRKLADEVHGDSELSRPPSDIM